MSPLPVVLGLTICEKIIVEEGTKNLTLISTFNKINVDSFPSAPQKFNVFTVLTEGQGHGTINDYQVILSLDGEWLAQRRIRVFQKE
jgi:hypothetical protein